MNGRGIRNDKLRRLYEHALRQGWTARTDGRGHIQLTSPSGRRFSISATSSGQVGRHFENTKSNARKAGLDVTGL